METDFGAWSEVADYVALAERWRSFLKAGD